MCSKFYLMERNTFLKGAGSLGFLAMAWPLRSQSAPGDETLDKALVQQFVGSSHKDMDKVKSLLSEYPTLLNAAHDWGRGDFETGLGAASHVGYKELVSFLLEKGAQANIFTACLFGELEIVKSMVSAFPYSLHCKGPHGYTLLHHAGQGGEGALEVKEYLLSKGVTKTQIPLY